MPHVKRPRRRQPDYYVPAGWASGRLALEPVIDERPTDSSLSARHLSQRGCIFQSVNPPLLFGDEPAQEILLQTFREGEYAPSRGRFVPAGLVRSGLVAEVPAGRCKILVLQSRHPKFGAINEILKELNGGPGRAPRISPVQREAYAVDAAQPLKHRCRPVRGALMR